MKSHGVSVDLRHIILLADLMTFKGLLLKQIEKLYFFLG